MDATAVSSEAARNFTRRVIATIRVSNDFSFTQASSLHLATHHHLVFLTGLESTLREHHTRGRMNFELALSAAALDAVLDLSVFADVSIVRENLTQISRVTSIVVVTGHSIIASESTKEDC